jgi:2-methylcitrate dehydratase
LDRITEAIASFASKLSFHDLPGEVVDVARLRLIDSVGCALAARDCDQVRIARRVFGGGSPGPRAGRVLGSRDKVSLTAATFLNTAMIRYLDFNDFYPGGHPSDILGALTAAAESAKADGRRLLGSTVVAYEIFTRISDSAKLREKGWDQGYAISVATAAGMGNLLGLDVDQLRHAVAIAAVGNVPLRATRAGSLSHWKGTATAYAAHNAVVATLLAAEGMTGPERPFEGRHGLWEQITGPFPVEPYESLGSRWLTPNTRLKYWPVEYNAQAGVWAAIELRKKVSAGELATARIKVYWSAWHEIGSEPAKWDPKTRETADHSLPYIFARTLVDGRLGLEAFEEPAYKDPALRPLMAKLQVVQDAEIDALWPSTVMMRVEAEDRAGRAHCVEIVNPLGHELNPMGPQEVREKFLSLASPVLGHAQATDALECWSAISGAADLGSAFESIEISPRTAIGVAE